MEILALLYMIVALPLVLASAVIMGLVLSAAIYIRIVIVLVSEAYGLLVGQLHHLLGGDAVQTKRTQPEGDDVR